jgi:hypothetical protein
VHVALALPPHSWISAPPVVLGIVTVMHPALELP